MAWKRLFALFSSVEATNARAYSAAAHQGASTGKEVNQSRSGVIVHPHHPEPPGWVEAPSGLHRIGEPREHDPVGEICWQVETFCNSAAHNRRSLHPDNQT